MGKRVSTKTSEEKKQIKERFTKYATFLGITNAQFCRYAGLSPNYIKTITGNPSEEKIRQFEKTYPAFNTMWAINGIGEMINDGYEGREKIINKQNKPRTEDNIEEVAPVAHQCDNSGAYETIEALKKEIEHKNSIIDRLFEKMLEMSDKIAELSKACK